MGRRITNTRTSPSPNPLNAKRLQQSFSYNHGLLRLDKCLGLQTFLKPFVGHIRLDLYKIIFKDNLLFSILRVTKFTTKTNTFHFWVTKK